MSKFFNICLTTTTVILVLVGCSIKDAVPEFEYPEYSDDKEWPKLSPTDELQNDDTVDVDTSIEEIEKLKRLAQS